MESANVDRTETLDPRTVADEVTLDEQRLDHLFSEVAQSPSSAQVFFRDGRPSSLAAGGDVLGAAREALRKQTTRGIHLRYRHPDGERWDTLTPGATGARLVRLRFAA
jgi:hypothetical protein